jgi:hypothetical protein
MLAPASKGFSSLKPNSMEDICYHVPHTSRESSSTERNACGRHRGHARPPHPAPQRARPSRKGSTHEDRHPRHRQGRARPRRRLEKVRPRRHLRRPRRLRHRPRLRDHRPAGRPRRRRRHRQRHHRRRRAAGHHRSGHRADRRQDATRRHQRRHRDRGARLPELQPRRAPPGGPCPPCTS